MPRRSSLPAYEHRNDTIRTADAVRQTAANTWQPNAEMENLRRLRHDNPAAFDRLAAGRRRISLATYEDGLREHLAAGGRRPKDVRPLDGDTA